MSFERLPDGSLVHVNFGRGRNRHRRATKADLEALQGIADALRKQATETERAQDEFAAHLVKGESMEQRDVREPRECRACKARILWTTTRTGKSCPVDAEPVKDGEVWLTLSGGKFGKLLMMKPSVNDIVMDPKRNRYRVHWSTCPEASKFRKPKDSEGSAAR